MGQSVLNEHIENYRKRFQTILEYTQVTQPLNEAEPEEDPAMGGAPDPNAMGGAPDPNAMGGAPDPNAMGGAPDPNAMGGEDPAMGMDSPDMMGGEDPAMGDNSQQGVEGLNPQGGEDPAMGMDSPDMMGGEDPAMGDNSQQGVEGLNPQGGEDSAMPEEGDDAEDDFDEMEEDDEVIDVDELTSYQQKTAKGVGKISDELRDLKKLISSFEEKVNANNQGIEALKQELQKRAPDAQERITLRQQKSGPFTQTVEDYWDNNAPDNYKVTPDDDIDNPKYVITKADIDGVTDWNNISKSFDEMAEFNDLRNIFDI